MGTIPRVPLIGPIPPGCGGGPLGLVSDGEISCGLVFNYATALLLFTSVHQVAGKEQQSVCVTLYLSHNMCRKSAA